MHAKEKYERMLEACRGPPVCRDSGILSRVMLCMEFSGRDAQQTTARRCSMSSIKPETLRFLRRLARNNNKTWFNRNRELYDAARANVVDLVEAIILGLAQYDESVLDADPSRCLFRIYRDTRFSKDKTPYKLNFGAKIGGRNTLFEHAGCYLHIEPGECFLGGGLYHPDPARLKGVRKKISLEGARFKKIVESRGFKSSFDLWGNTLRKVPAGYSPDSPAAEYLKYKDLVVLHGLENSDVMKRGFDKYCVKVFRRMPPFNAFLNEAAAK
ncbi:MAG: TIGR02453 family protein [Chitinivibrionales bacterium]|nr:TIGR02453 family protein [Chitinivibrionales bacterium]MBD3397090.1 TIGR02453 family protein [Chitinivibrionales bacterium]